MTVAKKALGEVRQRQYVAPLSASMLYVPIAWDNNERNE